jgi:hypothetical protein
LDFAKVIKLCGIVNALAGVAHERALVSTSAITFFALLAPNPPICMYGLCPVLILI